ncbi:uncharacterized protein F5891DRAFT_1191013 [Suillus fuscotomentosus]|uniref:Uncharacterized protein n=1 Tax=Suillus fuscotomentosus TaxID=1912939 RepID=A0AAD4E4G8_9AGAM|nr:uncharacterized protein F5891DRAFT_1191013 [Suillus fuscotomentosus]KAG1898339.1 hypothetical protein F5891DRAFT_1191013 [Suillus fuscotomentosus]
MTFKKVRFLTPEEPYLGDIASTCSTYSSDASEDGPVALGRASDKGLIDWLGSYVPLELWTPPALSRKPRMKGVVRLEHYPKFKKYDLTKEFLTDHEKLNDLFAQRDQVYDLCFNGHFDEIGSMLAGESPISPKVLSSLNKWCKTCMLWNAGKHPEMLPGLQQGMAIPTTADGMILVRPSQRKIPTTVGGIVIRMIKASRNHVGRRKMLMTAVGIILWMIKPSCNRVSRQKMPTDCGWDHPMDDQAILQSGEPAADAYDCGWDHLMDDQAILQSGEPAADPYDCGWDNHMNATEASSNVMEEYVGIVASEDGGSAGDDPYDCGWAAPEVSRQTATGSNAVNAFASSGEQAEDNETNVFEHAEHSMRSAIRILHDIRPNNIHHNANGIATTAEHVLNPMLIPTSFRDSRQYRGSHGGKKQSGGTG